MKEVDYKSEFKQKGFLKLPQFFNKDEMDSFIDCAEDLMQQEEKIGGPMKYFERSGKTGEELLNRVENFVDVYKTLKKVVMGEKLNNLLKTLADKNILLFKDKINFKLPGGGGFSVHQDAPAFTSFTKNELIVVMVSVDKVNVNNGCMQIADNFFKKELVLHVNGKIPENELIHIKWKDIELVPGDVFVFSSFLIHRSADNLSSDPRRCFYLTFNDAKDGDMRKNYFAFKRKSFPPRIERTEKTSFEDWKSRLAKPIL